MKKTLVLAFFSFHILSLGIGAIPSEAADPLSRGFRMLFEPITGFYLNATGQWQKWNLFAPDPPRMHSSYVVHVLSPSRAEELRLITQESISWYQRTSSFKILRTIFRDEDRYADLRASLLRSLCTKWNLPAESTVRLHVRMIDVLDSAQEHTEELGPISCTAS